MRHTNPCCSRDKPAKQHKKNGVSRDTWTTDMSRDLNAVFAADKLILCRRQYILEWRLEACGEQGKPGLYQDLKSFKYNTW